MAQTSWGFDGTINEAQWSEMAGLLGNGYVAADSASCVVTAVPGARSVSVSAGTLYGDGIVTVLDAAETVPMTTPVNGQWYVIALRRTWATNSTALVAIAGATTSTSTPTAPPSTLPTLNADPGVLTDQPIAWGWCNSANTTVVVFDMRQFPVRRMPLTVANNVVRDGIFQTPTQGQQVWRNDLGAVETYYGAYNAISNPGGRDTAGWYVDDRQTGLRPVAPTTLVIASGSGSVNALGQVSFSGASAIELRGVFSSVYRRYAVLFDCIGNTNGGIRFRFMNGATENSSAQYNWHGLNLYNTTAGTTKGDNQTSGYFGDFGSTQRASTQMVLFNPFTSDDKSTQLTHNSLLSNAFYFWTSVGNITPNSTAYDGIKIFTTAGQVAGTVQVFGYND